jgi:hypothetical protein
MNADDTGPEKGLSVTARAKRRAAALAVATASRQKAVEGRDVAGDRGLSGRSLNVFMV